MEQDHYGILGLRRDASQADVKSAFRSLIKKYHPDRHPDSKVWAEWWTKSLIRANDALSDPDARKAYDAALDRVEYLKKYRITMDNWEEAQRRHEQMIRDLKDEHARKMAKLTKVAYSFVVASLVSFAVFCTILLFKK